MFNSYIKKISIVLFVIINLSTLFIYSQSNNFKLGFTGAYPNHYGQIGNNPTYKVNWDWYDEFKMNTWSGWWVGDTAAFVFDHLKDNNIAGLFQPDTLRWAAYGRMQVNEAEYDDNIRFSYGNHRCGSNYQDNTQFGSGQWVRYFNKNDQCNEEQSPEGLVLWNVKENGFQSFCSFPYDPVYQVPFPRNGPNGTDTKYLNTYYIKPRMRIESAEALSFPPKDVCKIIIKAYNGDIIKQIIIQTDRFKESGSYNGQYIEDYFDLPIFVTADSLNRGRPNQNPLGGQLEACRVDYQIYWYGTVSVWIDYVKVMDEAAHSLFGSRPQDIGIRLALADKIARFKDYEQSNGEIVKGFYMEEVDYSNLACLKYLNEVLLPQWSGNDPRYKMIGLVAPWSFRTILKNKKSTDYSDYFTAVNPPFFMNAQYPFASPDHELIRQPVLPDNLTYDLDPNRYPQWVIDGFTKYFGSQNTYGIIKSKAEYNARTQNIWDAHVDSIKPMISLCRTNGKEYYLVPQVHYLIGRDGNVYYLIHKEPMNSEISAEICLALCYGAHGIIPYAYESGFWNQNWDSGPFNGAGMPGGIPAVYPDNARPIADHTFGMTDINYQEYWGDSKRTSNFYGENKWQYVKDLYSKIESWGKVLANSNNTTGYSVHRDGANHNFISDILSIDPNKPAGTQNPCVNDYQTSGLQYGPYCDCPDERYWEMGFFSTNEPNTKYFMMVNRRCVPEGNGYAGDDRILRIKFNITSGPVNWKISEVGGTTRPVTFSRNYQNYLDLGVSSNSGMGWFKPGEGKLFKLQPVSESGGELVEDEILNGGIYSCRDTVFNNGYNITIDSGATVSFIDSSCIVMTGGTFTSGTLGSGTGQLVTYKGEGSTKWGGLRFNNTTVKIYNSKFQDISSPSVNYAVSMYNCPLADIRGNEFDISTDTSGAVQSVYVNTLMSGGYQGIYVNDNTIAMNNSRAPAIVVQGFAGLTLPAAIMNNTVTSGGYATGVMITNITSAAVKKNSITGFSTGVSLLGSTADMYGNNITNTSSVSKGVTVYGESILNMAPSAMVYTGGYNVITNTYGSSVNIELNNSTVLLDNGNNTFDISSSATPTAYHLYGSFMEGAAISQYTGNCYKLDGTEITSGDPNQYLTAGNDQISMKFNDYICNASLPENLLVVSLGNNVYDTIPDGSYGMGGGYSNTNSKNVSRSKRSAAYTLNPKSLFDSIHLQMSRRDYINAKTTCYNLINTYPDSMQSISSLQTLYLCTTATDTTYNGKLALKTFYESLILNHGSNVSLVKISNYLIQKCKVLLGDYSQALVGFQQIINNNPYSYEGLLARWDYMATSLLIQGQGGGISSIDNLTVASFGSEPTVSVPDDNSRSSIDIVNALQKEAEDDDKSPYTKEQRNDIRKSINTAIEISKDESEKKIKTLEVSSDKGDENAAKELSKLRTLKQIIKTEKPKTVIEHIHIVSQDIKKVFGTDVISKSKTTSSIPTVYRLSQNYPNPFNPTTKINYDLPRDSKVSIVIYDILGREVKRLVNNEIKTAGAYIIDFNASNYASGVYFYRIEAEESNGNKFVDSKKMVLIK